jgi:hypothetical protein
MAFGAVTGQPETGMTRHRLVPVTGRTALLFRMAVGKPVFMTRGADLAQIVLITAIGAEMLAGGGMADIADAGFDGPADIIRLGVI